jgi:hypothetical protein
MSSARANMAGSLATWPVRSIGFSVGALGDMAAIRVCTASATLAVSSCSSAAKSAAWTPMPPELVRMTMRLPRGKRPRLAA